MPQHKLELQYPTGHWLSSLGPHKKQRIFFRLIWWVWSVVLELSGKGMMYSKFHHLLLFPSLSVQPHWWLDLVFYALPIVSYDTLLNKNGSHGMVSSESIDMPSPPSFHSSCIVGTAHGSDGLLPVLLGQCFPFFPRGLLSCSSFCLVLDIGN